MRGAGVAAALGAVLALALPASAGAETRINVEGHILPVIRTMPTRPLSMTLKMSLRFSTENPDVLPPILDKATMQFPYGSAVNGRLFPSCDPATLVRRGSAACPKGSEIGRGQALGAGDNVRQRLTVTLYNGAGGRGIVFYFRGSRPLRVNVAFNAPLTRLTSGPFNYRLFVDVPKNLERVAGVDLAALEFDVTVGATRTVRGRKRGYIEAYACPPGALVPVRGEFDFLEAPSKTVQSYIGCG